MSTRRNQISRAAGVLMAAAWFAATAAYGQSEQALQRIYAHKAGATWNVGAFSPDNELFALAEIQGNALYLLDRETGAQLAFLPAPDFGSLNDARAIAFSPDGSLVAAGNETGAIHVWDVATGALFASVRHAINRLPIDSYESPAGIRDLRFSPDGTRLASAAKYSDQIHEWDPLTGEPLATRQLSEVVDTARFSDDLTRAIVNGERVWSLGSTPAVLYEIDYSEAPGLGELLAADMSPDGGRVVYVTSGFPGVPTIVPEEPSWFHVVDVATGDLVADLSDFVYKEASLRFAPNGEAIFARLRRGGAPGPFENFLVDSTNGAKSPLPFGSDVFLSHDMEVALDTSDNAWRVLDAATGDTLHAHPWDSLPEIGVACLSSDGATLYVHNELGHRSFDATTGDVVADVVFDPFDHYFANALAPIPGTDRLVAAIQQVAFRGPVEIDAETSEILFSYQQEEWQSVSTFVVAAPDGSRFAQRTHGILDNEEIVSIDEWERGVAAPVRVFSFEGSQPTSASYSPDSSILLTADTSGAVILWGAGAMNDLMTLDHGEHATVAAFSPDGTRILSAGETLLKSWDASTGDLVYSVASPLAYAPRMIFSPDASLVALATRGDVGPQAFVDPLTGALVAPFQGAGNIIGFSPDGTTVYSEMDAGLFAWSAPEYEPARASQIVNGLLGLGPFNEQTFDLNHNKRVESGDVVTAINAGRR